MAAVVLITALLWAVHVGFTLVRPARAVFSFDSAGYALAGRELARTGVLTTPFSYVGALREGLHPPWPLLAGHPLLPLLEAPVFLLFGEHPWGSLVPVALAYLATVALALLLALEGGPSVPLAAVAALALAATPAMLANACDGLSELPFTAVWTGALLLLARFRRAPRALAIGVLLGLAHLARPVAVPTLPAWLAAVAWAAGPGQRVRRLAALLAGFAPFALAIALYKWRSTGSPFAEVGGIMVLTGLAPEFTLHDVARLLHPPGALAWIQAHPGALVHKLAGSLPYMSRQALSLGGWASGIAFAVWLVRPRADGTGPLRLGAGLALAALVALAALTTARPHFLFPMLPAVIALGAGELERLARAAHAPQAVSIALVAGILSWSSLRPLAAEWAAERAPARRASVLDERSLERFGSELARRLPPGSLVASDVAPWVSWYADRPSVNVPLATADLAELRARYGLAALVLTNEWLVTLPGNEPWREAFEGSAAPAGWTVGDTLAFGRLRVRLLLPR